MRIIKESTVKEAAKVYPRAAAALHNWIKIVRVAAWSNMVEMRKTYPQVDIVIVKSGRPVFVFNICGNDFRLIAAVHFNTGSVFFLRFLTHANYSKNNWKNEL